MADKVRLVDTRTNRVVAVPANQATELVRSGLHSFIPGTEIELHSPEGEGFITDAENALSALQEGFQIDTKELKSKREVMREYGEKDFAAAAAGVARGLTGGLSDPILTQGLGVNPETLHNLEEANPAISATAEVGSFIGSLLATGGTSAAAKGVSVGARALTGAGKVAEKTLSKAIAGKAGSEASQSFARKLLEKSSGAIAQGATEGAILETTNLLSENALGRAELNAESLLANAGIGAVIGGTAGVLFEGIGAAVPALTKATGKGIQEGQKRFLSQEKAVVDLFGLGKRDLNKLEKRGISVAEVADLTKSRLIPKDGTDFAAHFDDTLKSMRDDLTNVYTLADDAAKISGLSVDNVVNVPRYISRLDELIEKNRGASFSGHRRELKKLKTDLANGDFLPLVNGQLSALDAPFSSAKELLDRIDDLAKYDKRGLPTPTQSAAAELRKMIREDINTAVAAQKGKLGPEADALFTEIQKLNRQSHIMLTLADNVADAEKKKLTQRALNFRDLVSIGVGSAVADTVGVAAALATKIGGLEGIQIAKFRALSAMEKANQTVAKRLAEAVIKIGEGSAKIAPTVRRAAQFSLSDFTFDPEKAKLKTSNESREEAFKRVGDELEKYSGTEARLDLLERRTETLNQFAPQTAGALAMKTVTALDFLHSKFPVNPNMGRVLNPFAHKWTPTKTEIAKFERYVTAINDPVSVVEQFSEGQVNREGIEVLRVVYPEMFNELQAAVVQLVALSDKPLPYKTRINLNNILDVSTDPSTVHQTFLMLQANLMNGPEHQAAMGASPARKIDLSKAVSGLTTESQDTAFHDEIA